MTAAEKQSDHKASDVTLDEALNPDVTLTIGSEQITVRAFRCLEGMRAMSNAKPIVEQIRKLAITHGNEVPPDAIMDCIANHPDSWLELTAMATGQPRDWIEKLSYDDGLTLALTMWGVNKDFFLNQLMLAVTLSESAQHLSDPSTSSTSSIPSSAPATDQTPEKSPSD